VAAVLAGIGLIFMPIQLILLALIGTIAFYLAEAIKTN